MKKTLWAEWAVALPLLFLLATLTAVTLSHRHLYADASFFFGEILRKDQFFIPRWTRGTANLWTQCPMVLGTLLGVRSISILSLLYGLGVVSMLPLSLFGCIYLCPKGAVSQKNLLLFPFLSTFSVFLLTGSFSGTESIIASCVFWPLFLWSLYPYRVSGFRKFLLFFFAGVSLASYETFLLFGPLIGLSLLLSVRTQSQAPESPRKMIYAIFGLSLIATGIAFFGSTVAGDGQRGHFLESILWLRGWRTLWFCLLSLVSMLFVFFGNRVGKWAAGISIFFALLMGCFPLLEKTAEPGNNYLARVYCLFIPLSLGVAAFIWMRLKVQKENLSWACVLIFSGSACFHQVVYVHSWNQYREKILETFTNKKGVVPIEESMIAPGDPGMRRLWQWNWVWAVSATSLWVSAIHDPSVPGIILCQGAGKDPGMSCPWNSIHREDFIELEKKHGVHLQF